MPPAAISDSASIELIDTVYEAAGDPAAWHLVRQKLHSVFPQASISTVVRDQNGRLSSISSNVGIDESLIRAYFEHYYAMNCHEPVLAKGRPGTVLRCSAEVQLSWLKKQAFYNEWLRPAGNLTFGTCLIVERSVEQEFRVAIDFPETYFDAEAASATLLERLSPHIARSFKFNVLMGGEVARTATIHALITRIEGAALILKSDRRIMHVNPMAEALLAESRILKSDLSARVSFTNSATHARFVQALNLCAGSSFEAPKPFLVYDANGHCSSVSLIPLRLNASLATSQEGLVLMVVKPLTANGPQGLAELQGLWDLTQREAQVAAMIAAGQGAEQISAVLGTSMTTVRNQIASAMQKMGVSRQVEIAAKLAQLRVTFRGD